MKVWENNAPAGATGRGAKWKYPITASVCCEAEASVPRHDFTDTKCLEQKNNAFRLGRVLLV